MKDDDLTRRGLLAAGGIGVLVAAGFAGLSSDAAGAAEPTAAEAANIKLVKDFVATWGEPGFDADAVMAQYLAADCSVRPIDTMPFVNGPAAVAAAFKQFAQHGERFKVKFNMIWAKDSLVVTDRIDTQVGGEKNGSNFPVVGIFLVKGGKIKEWTDYVSA